MQQSVDTSDLSDSMYVDSFACVSMQIVSCDRNSETVPGEPALARTTHCGFGSEGRFGCFEELTSVRWRVQVYMHVERCPYIVLARPAPDVVAPHPVNDTMGASTRYCGEREAETEVDEKFHYRMRILFLRWSVHSAF